jgi:hypothetical protein
MAMNFRRKQRRNAQWNRFRKAAAYREEVDNGRAGM